MSIDALIVRLRMYNAWRRGADIAQPDPAEIGRDIDEAIVCLEKLMVENRGEG